MTSLTSHLVLHQSAKKVSRPLVRTAIVLTPAFFLNLAMYRSAAMK